MTKEERLKAAEAYAEGKSSSEVFRQAHIADFLAGAEAEAESNWVEYNGQDVEQGCYWVVVDGKTQEAVVNEKEYAELVNHKGFWQYDDSSLDMQVFPTHYMKYEIPSPPLNQQ